MENADYLDRIAHLELLVEHYKDRYAQLLETSKADFADMANQFKEFNTSLTVAASTLENAMSRIIAMQPVVEAAIEFTNGSLSLRKFERVLETFLRISAAS